MSEIKVKELKCPVCGAPLKLNDQGYGQTTCEYCRAIVYVDREDTTEAGEIVVYNKDDNKPIATLNIPIGWNIANTFVNYNKATKKIPYSVGVDLENNMGSIIHIETGNSFEGFGAASYLGQTQEMHTIQKDFEPVDNYLDEYVSEIARANNKEVRYKENLDIPVENYDKMKDFKDYQLKAQEDAKQEGASVGMTPNVHTVYCDSACRAYDIGNESILVAYTKEYGNMMSIGGFGGIQNGINNLMQGIGNFANNARNNVNNGTSSGGFLNRMADSGLLGGMLGQKFRTQPNANMNMEQEQAAQEPKVEQEQVTEEPQNTVYIGQFRKPAIGETYTWMSDPIFVLITSKEEYSDLVQKAFKQVCSTFKLSPEVMSEYRRLQMQWEQENRTMMNSQAQAQYQNGQNLINLGQQRMAANQRYVESMMERSNKQYQMQRDSYNSRVAAQDRMRDARSEAIRGVNTYIKPDGKEVEVSVRAESVWINGKGEIVGGDAGFNPGSGWTKLERK